jgi:hypothetical protein
VHSGQAADAWPPDPPDHPHWRLQVTARDIAVLGAGSSLAGARISAKRDITVIELWSDQASAPSTLRARLVDEVLAHPTVRAHRTVLVCVPRGDSTAITALLRRLPGARARPAGATCLIEGPL